MGLLNWLRGIHPPPRGVERQSAKALRTALLAVNRKTAPFHVRDGKPEGVDLVAEWRILDAQWSEIFEEAGIERTFKMLMKVDEAADEVRAVDQEWEVEWHKGVARLSLAASAFRGRTWERSYGAGYAFREDGSFGKIYEYRFDSGEIRAPLIDAAHAAGWGWHAVAFAKL
jgi:hypothetical protein